MDNLFIGAAQAFVAGDLTLALDAYGGLLDAFLLDAIQPSRNRSMPGSAPIRASATAPSPTGGFARGQAVR